MTKMTILDGPPHKLLHTRPLASCTKTSLQQFTYDFEFGLVVSSYMLRYPHHPRLVVLMDSHVLKDTIFELDDEDNVVEPDIQPVGHKRKVRMLVRRCFLDVDAPTWLKRTLGVHQLIFIQTSLLDPQRQSMRIVNYNEIWQDKAVVGDDCEYKVNPENPSQTLFCQYGFFQLPKYPLSKTIEKFMCKTWEKHTHEGRVVDVEFVQKATAKGGYWDLKASLLMKKGLDELIFGMDVQEVDVRALAQQSLKQADGAAVVPPSPLPDQTPVNVSDVINSASIKKEVSRKAMSDRRPFAFTSARQHQLPSAKNEVPYLGSIVPLAILLPNWVFGIGSPVLSSLLTVLLMLLGFISHFLVFNDFWIDMLSQVIPPSEPVKSGPIADAPEISSTIAAEEESAEVASTATESSLEAHPAAIDLPPSAIPNTSSNSAVPYQIQATTSASRAPSSAPPTTRKRTGPTPEFHQHRTTPSNATSKMSWRTRPGAVSQPSELFSDNDDSSDDEDHAVKGKTEHDPDDDELDFEVDEDEDGLDDLDAENNFLVHPSNPADDAELGDLTSMHLRDIKVGIPAIIDKSIISTGLYVFILEVTFPNGTKRTVERLYTDFIRLRKYLTKTIPQCKVSMEPTFIPKKKNDPTILGMSLDYRRDVLQRYLQALLMDEGVEKLGRRVLLEFCKFRGMLFGLTVRKRKLFGGTSIQELEVPNSATAGTPLSQPPSPVSVTGNSIGSPTRVGVMMKVQWRTHLKEVRVMLDRQNHTFNVYCKFPQSKDVHCSMSLDDLESVTCLNATWAALKGVTPPIQEDKYQFMELASGTGESLYFCATKDVVEDWIREIKFLKEQQQNQHGTNALSVQPSPASKTEVTRKPSSMFRLGLKKRLMDYSGANSQTQKVIFNHKRLKLVPEGALKHPCLVIQELLKEALDIFQEYSSDSKGVIGKDMIKRYRKFAESTCELQLVDLDHLTSAADKLSFYINTYHTLVVHSHIELNLMHGPSQQPSPALGSSKPSAKQMRALLRSTCYDIGNQVFSLEDIEHSVLRARMSKPVLMSQNSLFGQISSPRFNKRDPRVRWILDKPDLRINFVLNSGVKSSIYNIWILSHEPSKLNVQLDHASTHFLNEQVTVDTERQIVYLPRICQYYAKDFGGSKSRVLKMLMPYMSQQMERDVKVLLKQKKAGAGKVKLRYGDFDWSLRGVYFLGHNDGIQNALFEETSGKSPLEKIPSSPGIVVENGLSCSLLQQTQPSSAVPQQSHPMASPNTGNQVATSL